MGPQNSKLALILAHLVFCDSNFFLPQRYDRLVYRIHSHWNNIQCLFVRRLDECFVFGIYFMRAAYRHPLERGMFSIVGGHCLVIGNPTSIPPERLFWSAALFPSCMGTILTLKFAVCCLRVATTTPLNSFAGGSSNFTNQYLMLKTQPLIPNCEHSMQGV